MTYAMETANSSGQSNEAVAQWGFRSKNKCRSVHPKATREGNRPETRDERQRKEALEEIFAASRSRFLAMANSILRNREDAEDAVQDAFISAYRHVKNFEGRSALRTWLTRIVLNSALMTHRKRKTAAIRPLSETDVLRDEEYMQSIPDAHPNPEMIHADRETLQFVDGVLEKMKPGLRQAFTMTFHEELSGIEASARLGVGEGTFKARLFRAKRHVFNQAKRTLATPIHKKPLRRFMVQI